MNAAAHLPAGEYWNYAEIAAYLGVTESAVRSYVSNYTPKFPEPAIKGGRIWRAEDVKAWQAERRGQGWRKGESS